MAGAHQPCADRLVQRAQPIECVGHGLRNSSAAHAVAAELKWLPPNSSRVSPTT